MQKAGPDDSLIILMVTAQQIADLRVYGAWDLDRDDLNGRKNSLYF